MSKVFVQPTRSQLLGEARAWSAGRARSSGGEEWKLLAKRVVAIAFGLAIDGALGETSAIVTTHHLLGTTRRFGQAIVPDLDLKFC